LKFPQPDNGKPSALSDKSAIILVNFDYINNLFR